MCTWPRKNWEQEPPIFEGGIASWNDVCYHYKPLVWLPLLCFELYVIYKLLVT